ncbi:MAG: DUF3842 family protein [Clostridia bacterium]|nr:DUF3842 family protein [Clostridia bacterium]MBQ5757115.1 DUF3842 family protein [Clostridia bacterium]
MKKVVVIDGQGGRLGRLLIESILKDNLSCELYAIGTNSIATGSMLKAGAVHGATGENPVIVAARDADVIIGPVGIISADSLLGEITPKIAVAIGQSPAIKLLIPLGQCNNQVIGVQDMSMSDLVRSAVERLKTLL